MRPTSRDKRRKAFVESAEAMFAEMEAWYDAHLEASYGEIEAVHNAGDLRLGNQQPKSLQHWRN